MERGAKYTSVSERFVSGDYSSDIEREIARLKWEFRNTRDLLDVLKRPSAFWDINGRERKRKDTPYFFSRKLKIVGV